MQGLVVDLFAGGGGASTGLAWALGRDPDYKINTPYKGKPMSKTAQVRMCGNSVPPVLVCALVQCNGPQTWRQNKKAPAGNTGATGSRPNNQSEESMDEKMRNCQGPCGFPGKGAAR